MSAEEDVRVPFMAAILSFCSSYRSSRKVMTKNQIQKVKKRILQNWHLLCKMPRLALLFKPFSPRLSWSVSTMKTGSNFFTRFWNASKMIRLSPIKLLNNCRVIVKWIRKKSEFGFFGPNLPIACHWSLSIPPENIRKHLFQGVWKETSGIKYINLT